MNNKVTYMGVFRDGTGIAESAIRGALALDTAGVDITCKNIKLATQVVEPPERIQELLRKQEDKTDVLIQNILPNYYVYNGSCKNIGYFFCETDGFIPSLWQHHLNLMDEVWVSCHDNMLAAENSGVTKPIKVIPIGCDANAYKNANSNMFPKYEYAYKFYHIGDFSERKNTRNLIKCYLEEFEPVDNVVLILKCYVEGVSPQESQRIISEEIKQIKAGLRRSVNNHYPPIVLISDYLSPKHIVDLHASCDCFITLERGAGWNLPAFDAATRGNWVIAAGWGGQTEFITDNQNGYLVHHKMIHVSGMDRCPYKNLYTNHHDWADPDLQDAKTAMRIAYQDRLRVDDGVQKEFLDKFNYLSVGNTIKEILNG